MSDKNITKKGKFVAIPFTYTVTVDGKPVEKTWAGRGAHPLDLALMLDQEASAGVTTTRDAMKARLPVKEKSGTPGKRGAKADPKVAERRALEAAAKTQRKADRLMLKNKATVAAETKAQARAEKTKAKAEADAAKAAAKASPALATGEDITKALQASAN